MAIQPRFAQAILSGSKNVEFRKRRVADDVKTVLIYETSPTQRIVGRFNVKRIVEKSPIALWREFGSVGGISRRDYLDYFAGHSQAVALVVENPEVYDYPIRLSQLAGPPAVPQSFTYLPASILTEVESWQGVSHVQPLPRRLVRIFHVPKRAIAAGTR